MTRNKESTILKLVAIIRIEVENVHKKHEV